MALRGTFYRCHLFTYGGPQTEGVDSMWTQDLVPVGDELIHAGELVELYATLDLPHTLFIHEATGVRIDILEQDHLLTGGLDDRVVSLVGTGAVFPDEGFEVAGRDTEHYELEFAQPFSTFLRGYVRKVEEDSPQDVAAELEKKLLIVDELLDSKLRRIHLITWWRVVHKEEFLDAEYYFIVNADGSEDQSETTMNVSPDPLPELVEPGGVGFTPESVARRILGNLATGLFDWSVSDEELGEVIAVLRALPPMQLLQTVIHIRNTGVWEQLTEAVDDAPLQYSQTLAEIANDYTSPNAGIMVFGDHVEIAILNRSYDEQGNEKQDPIVEFQYLISAFDFEKLIDDHPEAFQVLMGLVKAAERVIFETPENETDRQLLRSLLGLDRFTSAYAYPPGLSYAEYLEAARTLHPEDRETLEQFSNLGDIDLVLELSAVTDQDRSKYKKAIDAVIEVAMPPTVNAAGQLRVPGVDPPLYVVGARPVWVANQLAQRYASGPLHLTPVDSDLTRPVVRIKFLSRGDAYRNHPLKFGATPIPTVHTSNIQVSQPSLEARLSRKWQAFYRFISEQPASDAIYESARRHYEHWVREHRESTELLSRTPADLWSWARAKANEPPPPINAYHELVSNEFRVLELLKDNDSAADAQLQALERFQKWIDQHKNRPDILAANDPEKVFDKFFSAELNAIVRAKHQLFLRELERKYVREQEEKARKLHLERFGKRLDEALELMKKTVWKPTPTRAIRTIEESGGFLGLFVERRGKSYLIQASETEIEIRNVIARAYLDHVMNRLRAGDSDFTVKSDFVKWFDGQPDARKALALTTAYPDVEITEFEVDLPAYQTAIEIGIGFVPIVGQIVAVAEISSGQSLFGRKLSTAERAITVAAILLPAAAKLGRTGVRAVRTSRLLGDYGQHMTKAERAALWRAVIPIAPGTPGRKLLTELSEKIAAGTRITDKTALQRFTDLIDDMGLTSPATRKALALPAPRPASGVRLASNRQTTKLIHQTLEGQTKLYRGMERSTRNAVRAAAEIEPGFLRRALRAETVQGMQRYRQELLERLGKSRIPDDQLSRVSQAIETLHAERLRRLSTATPESLGGQITAMSNYQQFKQTGKVVMENIERRLARNRARITATGATAEEIARAQRTVERIRREREFVSKWINLYENAAERTRELEQLSKVVAQSAYLRNYVAGGGGAVHNLQRLWIEFAARTPSRIPRGAKRLGTTIDEQMRYFPRYVSNRMKHYRGAFGETEVAFRMGDDFTFLKAPDEFVTLPGTDLVAVSNRDARIFLIDNKAFSAEQIDAVGALTRNLPRNLADDVDEIAILAGRPGSPARMRNALTSLRAANTEIQTLVQGMSRAQIESAAVQRQIGEILGRHGIQRVVTNAGGQVSRLSADLRAMQLDLLDLN